MSYYFNKTVPDPFDKVIEKVTRHLQDEGFRVLSEINIQETLKKKLNLM